MGGMEDGTGALNTPLMTLSAIVLRTLRARRSFFNSDRAAGGVVAGASRAIVVYQGE